MKVYQWGADGEFIDSFPSPWERKDAVRITNGVSDHFVVVGDPYTDNIIYWFHVAKDCHHHTSIVVWVDT